MDRFLTPERIWPDTTLLHVYLLPDLSADAGLAALVNSCRQVAEGFDFLSPVSPEWLHVTLAQITVAAAGVEPEQRDQLVAALTDAVADLPPFRVTAGSPLAGAFAIMLDVDGPGKHIYNLHARVCAAIGSVLGADALGASPLPPHLTLAYAVGAGDAGPVAGTLRRIRPSQAGMTVREIHLVDVRQHADRSEYRWSSIAAIPLGGRVVAETAPEK